MNQGVRKAVRKQLLLLAGASMVPLAVHAAAPGFGNWDVTTDIGVSGVIDGCPSTYQCAPLVAGNGFLQQQVTKTGTTEKYIQTIITDVNANGSPTGVDWENPGAGQTLSVLDYSDESFIQMESGSGLASNQRVAKDAVFDASGEILTQGFASTSTILTGWAETAGKPVLEITQQFVDPGNAGAATPDPDDGDEYYNYFNLLLDQVGGVETGKSLSIRQDVEMGNGQTTNTTDVQSFVIEGRSGDRLAANGSLTLASPTGGAETTTDNSGTATWTAGDEVMVAWIGQQIDVADEGAAPAISKFGFESVRNLTTNAVVSTYSMDSLTITDDPYAWDSTFFGAAPAIPVDYQIP